LVDKITTSVYLPVIMKVVLQRVRRASVKIFDEISPEGRVTGAIDRGLVLLVGLGKGDRWETAMKMAGKIVELRIFEDAEGKMNRSLAGVSGGLLIISQFTLYGDTRKGRRPSFTEAMPPQEAEEIFLRFVKLLKESGLAVAAGVFGAKMEVEIINDGPVTFILENEPAAT